MQFLIKKTFYNKNQFTWTEQKAIQNSRLEFVVSRIVGMSWKINNVFLGVAKKDRQKGLGDKLVKHALNYAREQDCSHAHTLASGVFSQVGFFYEFDWLSWLRLWALMSVRMMSWLILNFLLFWFWKLQKYPNN